MTKDEKNRKIAEWLEGKPESELPPIRRDIRDDQEVAGTEKIGIKPNGDYYPWPKHWYMGTPRWVPMDFFASEEANALVLEKMRDLDTVRASTMLTSLFNELRRTQIDRKTAICEAALALIEAEEKA